MQRIAIFASGTGSNARKIVEYFKGHPSIEVSLAPIEEGQSVTFKWRGKPVFVRRRTAAEIAEARAVPMDDLIDPEADDEWLIKL